MAVDLDLRPMLIEVTVFGTYHMRGTPTPRTAALMAVLKDEGGINMSVPPGMYRFNVIKKDTGQVLSLEPA